MHRTCHMQIYNALILLFLHHQFLSSSVSAVYLCSLSFGGLYLRPHFSKLPTSRYVFSESHLISQSSLAYLKKKCPLLACNITLIWLFPFPGALPDQGLNPGLLHCTRIPSHQGRPNTSIANSIINCQQIRCQSLMQPRFPQCPCPFCFFQTLIM